jgi:hypothetical protein
VSGLSGPAPDTTAAGDGLGELTVDLALYLAGGADAARLVLRRTVSTASVGAGSPAAVEELWASDELAAPLVRTSVRAALGPVAAALLLAEPVPVVPGLHRPTHSGLDDLAGAAPVEHLVGCRGTVRGAPGPRALGAVEVVGGAGMAGHVARMQLRAAVDGQGMVPAAGTSQPPPGEPAAAPVPVRAALRADVEDARARLAAAQLWRLLAGGPLGTGEPTGAARFRLVRLLPGPAALTAGPGGPDPDRALVSFVEPGVGRTVLVGHRCAPGSGPDALLRRPGVVAALEAYSAAAADPDTEPAAVAAARVRAVDALGGESPGHRTSVEAVVPALHGTVVLQDSCGVPVGNRAHRFSTAAHVLAPSSATATLLQARPETVRAVVEHACAADELAAVPLQQRLADAVCAAEPAEAPEPGGRVAELLGADPAEGDPRTDPVGRLHRALAELAAGIPAHS